MIAFPAVAALLALACALLVLVDAVRRPKPDKIAWAVAFGLFALAAGAEVAGALFGWTPALARVYYLAGAVLVVGFLALGELYLLLPKRMPVWTPGAALLVAAVAATVVLDAPIDAARLPSDGWRALQRGPALVALAAGINVLGTVVLAGGALWSARRFRRLGIHRHRMIGCLLIAVGTLLVASGGTLTRFGRPEYLYLAMSAGIATIFAGYLAARRPERVTSAAVAAPAGGTTEAAPEGATVAPTVSAAADPGIEFIEGRFLPLAPEGVAALCDRWGATASTAERFDREGARRVWGLRRRLSPAARDPFDALPVPTQLRLAELYFEVFAVEAEAEAEPDRPRRARPVEAARRIEEEFAALDR